MSNVAYENRTGTDVSYYHNDILLAVERGENQTIDGILAVFVLLDHNPDGSNRGIVELVQ